MYLGSCARLRWKRPRRTLEVAVVSSSLPPPAPPLLLLSLNIIRQRRLDFTEERPTMSYELVRISLLRKPTTIRYRSEQGGIVSDQQPTQRTTQRQEKGNRQTEDRQRNRRDVFLSFRA